MFPLGTVLLPGAPLQLQVFEPRYQALLADCLAGDASFGVVLIERGQEVGGGDQRSDVGTVAQIIGVGDLGKGRSSLLAAGTRRIRVTRWLPDSPYPKADVHPWPDDPARDTAELSDRYARCTAELRHLLALANELGLPTAHATFDVPEEPGPGSYLLAALTPLGPFDHQHLLCAPDPLQRLELLGRLIDEQRLLLELDVDPN